MGLGKRGDFMFGDLHNRLASGFLTVLTGLLCNLALWSVLICAALLVRTDEVRAHVVEKVNQDNIEVIEFHGERRPPGGIFDTVTVLKAAFADAATAMPTCTPNDFATFVCRTQWDFPNGSLTLAPISVERALTGYSPKTSYRHPNGGLEMTFTDFLPVNNTGPDLAVFQGFTQSGFSITARDTDGVEYGPVDVDSTPFLQIEAPPFDETGNPWGPCPLESDINNCGNFPNLRSQILLLYEIDLSMVGLAVPDGIAIEAITISAKQGADTFGKQPHVVMAAALQGDFTGPGPKPDPDRISGMIKNGFFENGLNEWTLSHPGLTGVAQTITGPAVDIQTTPDDQPTQISQLVSTPNMSFIINFDYKFLTDAGSLDVLLAGKVIDNIPAQQSDIFKPREILVNDTDLMGVPDAELVLRINPGSFGRILIASVYSPVYDPEVTGLFISASGKIAEGWGDELVTLAGYPGGSSNAGEVCWVNFNDCEVDTQVVFSNAPASHSEARSYARGFLPFSGASGGVAAGNLAFALSDKDASPPEIGSQAESHTSIVGNYDIPGSLPRPFPLDYSLVIGGTVTIAGDFSGANNVPFSELATFTYEIDGDITTERATMLDSRFSGKLHFNGLGVFAEDDFQTGSTCSGPSTPAVGPPVEQFDSNGNLISRVYTVLVEACVQSALYAQAGGNFSAYMFVSMKVNVNPDFDGYVLADFANTATAKVTTTEEGIEFVLNNGGNSANQPPVANAGEDQTVPADASCSATVSLDGSGSSDPDNDPLTYEWTGPFGTATGVNPTVTLPLGVHSIDLTVDDGNGGTHTDTVFVTVADQTTPVIAVIAASPDVLWPPNHNMVEVTPTVTASDACDPDPEVVLLNVTMNEGDEDLTFDPEYDTTQGDGKTLNDIQYDASTGQIWLRAERSGSGTGRIYTLTFQATDDAGNTSSASTTVTVPRNQ